MFLSYKSSFVVCTWKYLKKTISTVRRSNIFSLYTYISLSLSLSFARYYGALRQKLLPCVLSSLFSSAFFILSLVELLCGYLMNTGGTFNDRSGSIQWTQGVCLSLKFLSLLLAVRNSHASLFSVSFSSFLFALSHYRVECRMSEIQYKSWYCSWLIVSDVEKSQEIDDYFSWDLGTDPYPLVKSIVYYMPDFSLSSSITRKKKKRTENSLPVFLYS